MPSEYPYLQTTKRLTDLFDKIRTAAEPDRLSYELLKKFGFTSSNDRTFVTLLKKLGFLDSDSRPTDRYKAYRHKGGTVLAEGIRELYSELFAIHENIQNESKENIKGAISRVTGRETKYVDLMTNTFMSLVSMADFESQTKEDTKTIKEKKAGEGKKEDKEELDKKIPKHEKELKELDFRYNVEIHLPATTDIAVYNAIFKSLKDHLLD